MTNTEERNASVYVNTNKKVAIKIYYRNQMTLNYKVQENQLRSIFTKNLTCVNRINYVNLVMFYRNEKLKKFIY